MVSSIGTAFAMIAPDTRATEPGTLPTVVARFGMLLDEVRDRSTYKFDFSRFMDIDLTAAVEPSVFTFPGSNGFTLPPTHFVSLSSTAAVVDIIDVSPHLEPLHLQAAIELAAAVAAELSKAGWKRHDRNVVSTEELRVRVTDKTESDTARWALAQFELGPAEALLVVKRLQRASVVGAFFGGEDAFLVNLTLADLVLASRLSDIKDQLKQQGGTTSGRTELDAYAARVRPLLENR